MKPELEADKPIYLQIAEGIEDDILQQNIGEETQVPSTNELAVTYRINPATAAKGINILVDEGILYKKRGIGMFVSKGAAEKIRAKRKAQFYDDYVVPMLNEASTLGISKNDVTDMIKRSEEE